MATVLDFNCKFHFLSGNDLRSGCTHPLVAYACVVLFYCRFGDSVNTTARIESTGENGRIHLSEECAAELRKFGKSDWVVPRR